MRLSHRRFSSSIRFRRNPLHTFPADQNCCPHSFILRECWCSFCGHWRRSVSYAALQLVSRTTSESARRRLPLPCRRRSFCTTSFLFPAPILERWRPDGGFMELFWWVPSSAFM